MKKIALILVLFLVSVSFVTAYGIYIPKGIKECFCVEDTVPVIRYVNCDCPNADYQKVYVDIEPGECPNTIGIESMLSSCGRIPIAILGTENFNVRNINPESIVMIREDPDGQVLPYEWNYEDVATPFLDSLCECHDLNGDGYEDLVLKFYRAQMVTFLNLESLEGQTVKLTLQGELNDGTGIMGQDCVKISKYGDLKSSNKSPFRFFR